MAERHDEDLVAELRALAGWLETRQPPDLRAAVRARIAEPPPRVRVPRRWLAAAAALLVALVIALVPQTRAAVAHAVDGLLRFAGIEVQQGQGRPAVHPSPAPLPSARAATLDEARRLARFPVRVPDALGVPERVEVADPAPDGAPRVVSLVYRGGAVRLDQFDGSLDIGFLKTTGRHDIEWVEVGGEPGLYFPTPHVLEYVDRDGRRHAETTRLAGPTLVWSAGRVTFRLEGPFTATQAETVARSVR
jgi:hypothetical protein